MTAAVFHSDRTHPEGSPLYLPKLDGDWPLRQRDPLARQNYLSQIDVLINVAYRRHGTARSLDVIDVRSVVGYTITPNGRVVFKTAPAPHLAYLIGHPSPVSWPPSHGWPVKLFDLEAPSGSNNSTRTPKQ